MYTFLLMLPLWIAVVDVIPDGYGRAYLSRAHSALEIIFKTLFVAPEFGRDACSYAAYPKYRDSLTCVQHANS